MHYTSHSQKVQCAGLFSSVCKIELLHEALSAGSLMSVFLFAIANVLFCGFIFLYFHLNTGAVLTS